MEAIMHNMSMWIDETDPVQLRNYLMAALVESGFKILDICDYNFQPQGYTALILLGESHLAIHTFPEQRRTYIELSSCVKKPFTRFNLIMAKDPMNQHE